MIEQSHPFIDHAIETTVSAITNMDRDASFVDDKLRFKILSPFIHDLLLYFQTLKIIPTIQAVQINDEQVISFEESDSPKLISVEETESLALNYLSKEEIEKYNLQLDIKKFI